MEAGSLTAFIDINFFASDGLSDCLLVYPFGLTHPHASGDMDFLFDDRLFTAQWNLDNLFLKCLLASADFMSRNAFNNNVFAGRLWWMGGLGFGYCMVSRFTTFLNF